MRQIALDSGLSAYVDDEDYKRINKYNWFSEKKRNTTYARMTARVKDENFKTKETKITMHRLVLNLPTTSQVTDIDHRDGNGLNNQKSNLRIATHSQNMMNQRMHSNNKSGYKGVHWHFRAKKWRVRITSGGKVHHIGLFTCLIKAAKAYDEAAIKYFGEFARPNFPKQ